MPPTPTPTPRRGRPPKDAVGLSRAAIVEAALAVVDDEGAAAVSMRSVARVLGVDAKSLYHHVADKDGLLDAVAEHVLAGLDLPTPTGETRTDLVAIADAFRERALAHPAAATLVLTRPLDSLAALAPSDAVLRVLLDAGAAPADAVHQLRAMLATVIGTLLREASAGPTFGAADDDAVARRAAVLAGSGLSAVEAVAPHLAVLDADAEWAFAVRLCVDAVLAHLAGGGAG